MPAAISGAAPLRRYGPPLVAALAVLIALAALLGLRLRHDAERMAAGRPGGVATIFHAFLARDGRGRLFTARPDARCMDSVFLAPRGGGKALRVWGAAFSRFGGDVAGCSYAFCRSCGGGAQACGCRLVTAAAYEPALVFADLRSRGQVLVEDGRWQKTMRFPAPTSRRQALGDLRKAARNWIALRH